MSCGCNWADDYQTIKILEYYHCPYPAASTMKVWNLNIFQKISTWPKHRVRYIFCMPDDQSHLIITEKDKRCLLLQQAIKNNRNDDFKYLCHLNHDIPYINDLFAMTFKYNNVTLTKFLLSIRDDLTITWYSYQQAIKSPIDFDYLDQIRALDQNPESSSEYLELAKSNVSLLKWFIKHGYLSLTQSPSLLNYSPQLCSQLVNLGLNISQNFFFLLGCIYSDVSARALRPQICNPETLWSTIQWLLKQGCRFHPVIGELLVESGNEKWCQWYASDHGLFPESCYTLAATSGSLALLNLIYDTGTNLVIQDPEDLIRRLIRRGSLTCIEWFESRGILFNICSHKIVRTLNANCKTKILYWALTNLIDFSSISSDIKNLFRFTNINLRQFFELELYNAIIEFLSQVSKHKMGDINLKLLQKYVADHNKL